MQPNEQFEPGRINTLVVSRISDPGLYLRTANDEEILLPNQYVTDEMTLGSMLQVFVYTDSEDRPVATTVMPGALRDEFGFFEVVDVTDIGAFLDWGLPKDLFVPRTLQKRPFKVGQKRIVRVTLDERTGRLIGSEKLGAYLSTDVQGLGRNAKVRLLVMAKTPLGYKVVVNDRYEGMIYENEIFEPVRVGETREGYVKQIRNDGKLDVSLRVIGAKRVEGETAKVLETLREQRGSMPYNYKSDADAIQQAFGMSKKSFKRALTELIERNAIDVDDTGMYLKEA